MANLENDKEVIKHIQKKYEDIVMVQKDKKAFYGTGYQTRSQSFTSQEPREPPREFRESCDEDRQF